MSKKQESQCPLTQLAAVDPESLPLGTSQDFTFKYIDISAVLNGRLLIPNEETTLRDAPSRARRILRNGDVIISTVRPNLKAFTYCELPDSDFIASTGFSILRAKQNADAQFILYALLSDDVTKQINQLVVGSNYPAINSSDVKRLLLPKFSLKKQRKIGTILSTIDRAIAHTEALIEKYQQIKAGLMHDLFTRGIGADGKLRPLRDEAPELYQESAIGWIPREWQFETLDRLTQRGSGHTPNKNIAEYWNGGVKWVSLADSNRLDKLYISETTLEISALGIQNSSAVIHPSGTVVMTRDAGVGKSAIISESMAVSQHFMAWRCTDKMDNHFLYYWLQYKKRMFENVAMGSTIVTIGLPYFKKLKIAAPRSVVEQKVIGEKLKSTDTLIFSLQSELEKLNQEKSGLMQDLLTGKVPVKVDSDEVDHISN